MTDVTVRLYDSVRLISAVLAATNYPEKVQEAHPHGSHAHSRNTARYLKPYRNHEAVKGMQALLDNGAPLEAMFTLVAHLPFPSLELNAPPKWLPPNWTQHLADFYEQAKLTDWWQDQHERELWDAAMAQSNIMFADTNFKAFLGQFVGEISETFVFMPNISYPSTREIGMRVRNTELVAVCPPRLAWGDSPPWPFDEDKPYIHRVALQQYGRLILVPYLRRHADKVAEAAKSELPVSDQFRAIYPDWGAQFINIFMTAAITIYLEELDKLEARAFIQEQVRRHNMKILPGAVSVLNRYRQERESGKFDELADFLLVFPKQLKVAKKIMSI
jgi:hypothetical protein